MKLLRMLGITVLALAAVTVVSAQSWAPVQNVPNIAAGPIALLTDGRILVNDANTCNQWWTLTPDINGNYATGTWKQVATMPSGYAPLYFGSAVLPDGRYIAEGGEYNNCGTPAWTKLGAIYDPVANTWTSVTPPSGWNSIGDSPSVILNNGTYMQSSCCDQPPQAALLNPSTLTWTSTGSGKFDIYDEEGLTLLPGGSVLDVDAYVFDYQINGKNWETYNPSTGAWTSQGSTPEQYWDSAANCGGENDATYELGPAVLMPNGTVFQAGANTCAAGHTGIYNVSTGTWTEGPDFPGTFDIADGPGALEVNGNVVLFASPGFGGPGGQMFEWNGSTLNEIPNPPNGPSDSSYYGHFLMLPNGQVMFTDFSNDVELLTSAGSQYTGWAPTLLLPNITMTHGKTVLLNGTNFNGASQNNAYGDDFQDASNYPIVRFTNVSTGHVFFGKTHDHNTMAVGYHGPSFTHVDIPSDIETGQTHLQVIVNGIASQNYTVVIN
ncbi:MAG: hypothetical protein WBW69_17365 [Candidatus Korobacteraceae bacterium]